MPNERYVIDERGQKVSIIVPIEEYEELLEDLHDLAVVAERRDELTSSFDEIKERLREKWAPLGLCGRSQRNEIYGESTHSRRPG